MLSRQCQLQKYCGNLNNIVLAVLFVDHVRVEQNKIGLKAQKGSDLDRALLQPKEHTMITPRFLLLQFFLSCLIAAEENEKINLFRDEEGKDY